MTSRPKKGHGEAGQMTTPPGANPGAPVSHTDPLPTEIPRPGWDFMKLDTMVGQNPYGIKPIECRCSKLI